MSFSSICSNSMYKACGIRSPKLSSVAPNKKETGVANCLPIFGRCLAARNGDQPFEMKVREFLPSPIKNFSCVAFDNCVVMCSPIIVMRIIFLIMYPTSMLGHMTNYLIINLQGLIDLLHLIEQQLD